MRQRLALPEHSCEPRGSLGPKAVVVEIEVRESPTLAQHSCQLPHALRANAARRQVEVRQRLALPQLLRDFPCPGIPDVVGAQVQVRQRLAPPEHLRQNARQPVVMVEVAAQAQIQMDERRAQRPDALGQRAVQLAAPSERDLVPRMRPACSDSSCRIRAHTRSPATARSAGQNLASSPDGKRSRPHGALLSDASEAVGVSGVWGTRLGISQQLSSRPPPVTVKVWTSCPHAGQQHSASVGGLLPVACSRRHAQQNACEQAATACAT
eukprot:3045993-Rhodomonas_salina.1